MNRLICFVCNHKFASPDALCSHIKNIHKICGSNTYRCSICRFKFYKMSRYRRHLKTCFEKAIPAAIPSPNGCNTENRHSPLIQADMRNVETYASNDGGEMIDVHQETDGEVFENSLFKSSLDLACKISSNMNIPRNYVFNLLTEFRSFISSSIVEPLTHIVQSNVSSSEKKYYVDLCKDPFRFVETECNLDSELESIDLYTPLIQFSIPPEEYIQNEEEYVIPSKKPKTDKGIIMPLKFQFKKFFEIPGVFNACKQIEDKFKNSNRISHFINGSLWKQKLRSFAENQTVIPYHLYVDGTQINNSLGTHRVEGNQTCVYYSFPTLPAEYSSRLENIFVAQLFPSDANKKHGNFCCFIKLIEELNKLATDGIILNIDGSEKHVFFVLGLTLGDNKEMNDSLGFSKSFSANYYCRFCRLSRELAYTQTTEIRLKMRNRRNYTADVMLNDFSSTGINEDSVFNLAFLFHVVESCGADIMHDILEGVLHYNMTEIILHFIESGDISLDELNRRKSRYWLKYGESDVGNISTDITMDRLESRKLLMSASEMHCFALHFPFILGDLIPKEDEVWKFFLMTLKVVDLVYQPYFTELELIQLGHIISEMNQMYVDLFGQFGQLLKPKHHILTHYPTLIRRYGPLRYISCMRFEAKHKFVKDYTKNTTSRVYISYSLGQKLQYNFAYRLLSNIGIDDVITINNSTVANIRRHYAKVEWSEQLDFLSQNATQETRKCIINGIVFSTDLWLPTQNQERMALLKILKIVFTSKSIPDIYFLCEVYNNVLFDDDFGSFEVDVETPEVMLNLINAKTVMEHHIYPVALHIMDNNKHRFRRKMF